MEPLFFKAENKRLPERKTAISGASMEPLFFKAENDESVAPGESFRRASMEPLFFKAENIVRTLPGCPRVWVLQWSRFFSKRKTGLPHFSEASHASSFNGAAFFKAENSQQHPEN